MIYASLVLATILASASAGVFPDDPKAQKALWDSFKDNFKKAYDTMDEEHTRFGHFLENLRSADRRNALEARNGGSAVHGVTILSDLSQAEFEAHFLTADVQQMSANRNFDTVERVPDLTMGLVDWEGKLTTPVKDQGYCGSCWAFSATEQIESDYMRAKGKTYLLSAEQITQCASGSYGCDGGWTEAAYKYVQGTKGMVQESDYKYTSYQGTTGTCKVDTSKAVVAISGYTTVKGESAMASYVQSTGPLSVCLDANSWNSYKGGIMTSCGKSVDHCVQAVGVDASSGGYWKVRNSWGPNWGEKGFIRLAYGKDTCAISHDPTYVQVK